jgi:hypothetical protein
MESFWFHNGADMASLNIKGLPPDVYDLLKESAQRNRRSLNQEAIVQLEKALLHTPPTNDASLMERIRERRARLARSGVWLTDEIINRAKAEGRP